jgi:glyoxylase-like metal-dependent hydrolase (beta-lactamase superfamily II)
VVPIPAGNPSEWTGPTGTNTYLLTGRIPALIDAGVGHPAHLAAIERGLAGRDLELILITHSHSDHIGGVPALLERWPRAAVRSAATRLLNGESIAAGDRTLSAVHTPGHSPDHFCFVDGERREVYCGDLLRIGGTVVIPASRGGDLRAYLESLRRIRDLRAVRAWPGHGPAIDDPQGLIDQYLAHREAREAQIVAALGRGCHTPAAIVPEVYGNLSSGLAAAAAESVLAHLKKLVEDDVVEVVEGRDVPRS